MKAKRTIDDTHIDIGIPASMTAETGMAVMTAENLIRCYENEGRKILKDQGYPLTFEELCRKRKKFLPDLANGRGTSPVYGVFWMLWGLNRVRVSIEKNNADMAVCDMTYALHWASKMQIKPFLPFIGKAKRSAEGASAGGKKKKEIDDARHYQWKLDAGKISEKYSSYTPWRIAGILEDAYKDNPTLFKKRGTIYKVIK